MNKKKVLCVCMGNTCRSPVVEAMLRTEAEKRGMTNIEFESAGTNEKCKGQTANEHSLDCMRERGIDLTSHRARFVGDLDLKGFDFIVVAEPEMKDLLLARDSTLNIVVANASEGGIVNPFQKGRAAYDEMVNAVERAIPAILELV